MANISQGTTDTSQEQPQEQDQSINLDELTTEQAFSFLTNAVRSQPFNYMEHVQLEQARVAVGDAIGFGAPAQ